MEKRMGKVNISAAGGTAAKGAKTCKITLPTSWLTAMGISEDQRSVELSFDGDKSPFPALSAGSSLKTVPLPKVTFSVFSATMTGKICVLKSSRTIWRRKFSRRITPPNISKPLSEKTHCPLGRILLLFWRSAAFPANAPGCGNI